MSSDLRYDRTSCGVDDISACRFRASQHGVTRRVVSACRGGARGFEMDSTFQISNVLVIESGCVSTQIDFEAHNQ